MEHHQQLNPQRYLGHVPDDIQKYLLVLVSHSTHTFECLLCARHCSVCLGFLNKEEKRDKRALLKLTFW